MERIVKEYYEKLAIKQSDGKKMSRQQENLEKKKVNSALGLKKGGLKMAF